MAKEETKTLNYIVEPVEHRNGKLVHNLYLETEHGKGRHLQFGEAKSLKSLNAGCVYAIETTMDGQSVLSNTARFVRRYYPEETMCDKRREDALARQAQNQYKAAQGTGKLGKTLDGIEREVSHLRDVYWKTSPAQKMILLASIIQAITKV